MGVNYEIWGKKDGKDWWVWILRFGKEIWNLGMKKTHTRFGSQRCTISRKALTDRAFPSPRQFQLITLIAPAIIAIFPYHTSHKANPKKNKNQGYKQSIKQNEEQWKNPKIRPLINNKEKLKHVEPTHSLLGLTTPGQITPDSENLTCQKAIPHKLLVASNTHTNRQ